MMIMEKKSKSISLECILALKKDVTETRQDIIWIKDAMSKLTELSAENNQHLSDIKGENMQQTSRLNANEKDIDGLITRQWAIVFTLVTFMAGIVAKLFGVF